MKNSFNDYILQKVKEDYEKSKREIAEGVFSLRVGLHLPKKPKRILKGSALCRHLLKTQTHVFCRVSDFGDDIAVKARSPIRCIVACRREVGFTFETDEASGAVFNNAVPINPITLEPLEMEINDE